MSERIVDMEVLLAAVGDGNLIRFLIGVVVGALIGWNVPQPAFIRNLFSKKD